VILEASVALAAATLSGVAEEVVVAPQFVHAMRRLETLTDLVSAFGYGAGFPSRSVVSRS
jgi:hypothetical protein